MTKSYLTTFLTLALALASYPLQAGSDDTASYYRANFDEYAGDQISMDVVIIRVLPVDLGDDYFAFVAFTWDDDNRSSGGAMAVVAPSSEQKSITRKFETTVDRDGPREPETERITGILQSVPGNDQLGRYVVYLDMTDGAFEPDTSFARIASVKNEKMSRKRGVK